MLLLSKAAPEREFQTGNTLIGGLMYPVTELSRVELGHIKVWFRDPHGDWSENEIRKQVALDFGLGNGTGDQQDFVQIWVCPHWKIGKPGVKFIMIRDERPTSVHAFRYFQKQQAVCDQEWKGSFASSAWANFWDWFISQDADLELVQMSNGTEYLVLKEGTAWMEEKPTINLLFGHRLDDSSYDFARYTFDRKARMWSWEYREEIWAGDHNLYRLTLTTDDLPEEVTVEYEEREDRYEEVPSDNENSDDYFPQYTDLEPIYHQKKFKITLTSTCTVSAI